MNPRVVLVTGGASGMGRIFAQRMAERGSAVAVLDRDLVGLEDVAGNSSQIHAFHCDVSNLHEVRSCVEQVTRELGSIDRAVHCAAIMPTAPLVEQDAEEIRRLMSVNYGGTVNVAKTVMPTMLERGAGELVIFGSTGGSVLVPECGAYCASKAATNAFAEVLIEETRGRGVHVMLVCPPLVDTPLLLQARDSSDPKMIRDSISRKRLADPESIIDEVERGLSRGCEILLPGIEAKLVMLARRIAPRLLWRLLHHFDRGTS
ncbi:MAG: SDR family oxidoreductase [Deltaproteobacteria bacterium]|nr:SDR family oxidoreductase [Deltaproteobacteria bacterium]